MSVVKQSQPRKYIENLVTFLSLDFEGAEIQEYDYYSKCSKYLSDKGLYSNELARLFDYSQSDKDQSRGIKYK